MIKLDGQPCSISSICMLVDNSFHLIVLSKGSRPRSQTALLAPRFDHLFIMCYLSIHGNALSNTYCLLPYHTMFCRNHVDISTTDCEALAFAAFRRNSIRLRKCRAKSGNVFCKMNSQQDANQTQRRCSKKTSR